MIFGKTFGGEYLSIGWLASSTTKDAGLIAANGPLTNNVAERRAIILTCLWSTRLHGPINECICPDSEYAMQVAKLGPRRNANQFVTQLLAATSHMVSVREYPKHEHIRSH